MEIGIHVLDIDENDVLNAATFTNVKPVGKWNMKQETEACRHDRQMEIRRTNRLTERVL
jgi:hypothetical protein